MDGAFEPVLAFDTHVIGTSQQHGTVPLEAHLVVVQPMRVVEPRSADLCGGLLRDRVPTGRPR